MQYFVKWSIDVWADSPEDAAKKALKIQRDDPESIATCFDVTDEQGTEIGIDLEEI